MVRRKWQQEEDDGKAFKPQVEELAQALPAHAAEDLSAVDAMRVQEYRLWKKAIPFLYDYLLHTTLPWPALAVDWMPNKEVYVQRL